MGFENHNSKPTGFNVIIDKKDSAELPSGKMRNNANSDQVYLVPVGGYTGLYDLKFRDHSRPARGALNSPFSIEPLNCGGTCGGLGLVPSPKGSWVAYDVRSQPAGNYKIRYWTGKTNPPDVSGIKGNHVLTFSEEVRNY